jgi:hypothetical protein
MTTRKKIIFFTAGEGATGGETTKINKLLARPDYELAIRNAAAPTHGAMVEACDYCIGAIPVAYNAKPVMDENNIPAQNLLATEAIVRHNVDIVTPVTGVYATKIKATIVAGAITGFVLS